MLGVVERGLANDTGKIPDERVAVFADQVDLVDPHFCGVGRTVVGGRAGGGCHECLLGSDGCGPRSVEGTGGAVVRRTVPAEKGWGRPRGPRSA